MKLLMRKKLLLAGFLLLAILLMSSAFLATALWSHISSKVSAVRKDLWQSLIQNEIKFLDEVKSMSNDNTAFEEVDNKITQTINLLKTALKKHSEQKNTPLSMFNRNRWAFISDQIEFLINLDHDFSSIPRSGEQRNSINKRIASLRANLVLALATDNSHNITEGADTASRFLYAPKSAITPIASKWSEGGSAIIYKIEEDFPCNAFIDSLVAYYSDLGFEAFKYDLCEPRRPAGISGGWLDNLLWTQFWTSNDRKRIVNANIVYSKASVFGPKGATVVIFLSNFDFLRKDMSYYNWVHASISSPPHDKALSKKFFCFRPLTFSAHD